MWMAKPGFFSKSRSPQQERYELPTTTVASAIHAGSYQRLQEAYDALLRWVGNNGYQVAGPIRELYLQNSQPVRQDDESYITEIQVPITKAA
jgi:effector-binding domain-containing protein